MSFGKFMSFEWLITLSMIKFLYWMVVLVSVLVGAVAISEGETLGGLAIILFVPIFTRFAFEGAIIMFRIHDELVRIRQKG